VTARRACPLGSLIQLSSAPALDLAPDNLSLPKYAVTDLGNLSLLTCRNTAAAIFIRCVQM